MGRQIGLARFAERYSTERFAASRPDVLVYETEELQEDLTVSGPIQARARNPSRFGW